MEKVKQTSLTSKTAHYNSYRCPDDCPHRNDLQDKCFFECPYDKRTIARLDKLLKIGGNPK